jgi:hypothetical protein
MPRLRVLAGPTLTSLVPISHIVNTDKPHTISSDRFEGQVVINIKGFTDPHGRVLDSEYFHRPDRKDITWSVQVQGNAVVLFALYSHPSVNPQPVVKLGLELRPFSVHVESRRPDL